MNRDADSIAWDDSMQFSGWFAAKTGGIFSSRNHPNMSRFYMKQSESNSESVDDLNAIMLKEGELFKVINDARWAHEIGMCSLMTGRLAVKKLYDEIPGKANAILARLEALSIMMKNDELKSWLLSDEISVMPAIAHKALVSAAAVHPLSIINGDITFEKESFLRKILEVSETLGSNNN
jgi:hypothetical protein